jgi:uncharacterized protein (DUF1330 family)
MTPVVQRRSISRASDYLWRAATLVSLTAVALACGGSSDDSESRVAPTATAAPATMIDRLVAAYSDESLDPSAAAWQNLLEDPGFETQPVAVVEFVSLKEGARADYDAYLQQFVPAIEQAGGAMLSINDILMPGLEGLESYEGGVSLVATFPTIAAYVEAMLDARVVEAAHKRRGAIDEAQVLMGPNLVPDVILQLPPNEPASDFPSDRVTGKSTDQIVDELLTVYPSGGADPTEETLRRMIEFEGFADQRVQYINLYRFTEGGEASLGEYNAAALPAVLAHGGRPKVLANVTHHLVGPTAWDRFIFVSWPSFAVFTDLRLDPTYIEAQKDRVVSAEQYGNLITVARPLSVERAE